MDGYIERMQAKENQCLALIQQADQVLEANGFQPSKEECVFLQRAANLRYEMAQMSVGEERLLPAAEGAGTESADQKKSSGR